MPTNATESEIKTMMGNEAGIYARLRNVLYLDAPSFLSREDTAYDEVEGQTGPTVRNGMAVRRAALSNSLLACANMVPVMLDAYAVQQNWGAGNRFQQLYEHWVNESVTVQSRDWSFGSPSAGSSNVGDGTIRRNTTDKYGFTIESGADGTREYTCIADANSGTLIGEESFEVIGTPPGPDLLDPRGLGINTNLLGVTGRDTQAIIRNPSFGTYSLQPSDSDLATLSSWTVSDLSSLYISTVDVYRTYQGETNAQPNVGAALHMTASGKIYQTIKDNTRTPLLRTRPYYAQIAFKRVNSCDGTLGLKIGSQQVTVALSAQSGWNVLVWKLDEDAWYDNFTVDGLAAEITLAGRTTGSLLIDDFILTPMPRVGPRYEVLVGGPALFSTGGNSGQGDSFTIEDAIGDSDCYMQDWLSAAGVYMPASDSPSFTEPTP